jgi:hypothetical protein
MKKCLAVLFTLFLAHAHAGVLIEPVVGYNFAKFEFPESDSFSASGPSFGGRIGYQQLGFQLGVDYLNSTLSHDEDDFDDFSMGEWTGFVGFEFPILLRVYAGYILSATASSENDDGDKVELTKGSGMKAGLGFTMLPFVDINVEYRKGTFDELEIAGVEVDGGTDYQSIMVGLSLPLNL